MQNGNTTYQEYKTRNGFSPEDRFQTISPAPTDTERSATARRNLLFCRFMKLLHTHAIERKPMTFYADKLCLSPDHFARTIKKAAGAQ
ncbi:MAG: hypothetical protein LUF85_02315 [Bacteroides sp.]|nr:hypothetical protein [Bacteroides sp.]